MLCNNYLILNNNGLIINDMNDNNNNNNYPMNKPEFMNGSWFL